MFELPVFEKHSWQYEFDWIIKAPIKYSEVLVIEFYTTYKGELQWQYPQGQLWKRGNPITSLMIRGVWVDIFLQTIGRFLYGLDYQASTNTIDIEFIMYK